MSYGKRKDFYHSKVWKKVRLNVWRKQNCLCYSCGLPVYVDKLSEWIPKEKRRTGIVHHIEHLTEANLSDDSITLDESNLIGVCKYCHEMKFHNRSTATREDVQFDENGQLIKREPMKREDLK